MDTLLNYLLHLLLLGGRIETSNQGRSGCSGAASGSSSNENNNNNNNDNDNGTLKSVLVLQWYLAQESLG